MKHLSAICLILAALMLCACAPAVPVQPTETVTPVPTAAPTAEPTATVEPTPEPTVELNHEEIRKQDWLSIWDILYDNGWTAYASTSYTDEQFFPAARSALSEMLPYISCMLSASWNIKKPIQEYPFRDTAENENDITDLKYVERVLRGIIKGPGRKHPDTTIGLANTIMVPDSALKDFMRICFTDYTEDMPIPEIEDITHINGTYRYTVYGTPSYPPTTGYVIRNMHHETVNEYNDKERFYMFVVLLDDEDHFTGGATWKVQLVKNDEPDALGINWRVEKLVRQPVMSNGLSICDGN